MNNVNNNATTTILHLFIQYLPSLPLHLMGSIWLMEYLEKGGGQVQMSYNCIHISSNDLPNILWQL